jgi:hypothetical protein
MSSHIGYMCKADFEFELDNGNASVYTTLDDLRKARRCVDECGIVEVEVKLVCVVQETDYSKLEIVGEIEDVPAHLLQRGAIIINGKEVSDEELTLIVAERQAKQ